MPAVTRPVRSGNSPAGIKGQGGFLIECDYNDYMVTNLREAKAQLSQLVQRAAAGEDIIITVHGRPVARMTAVVPAASSQRDASAWMAELAAEAEAAMCGPAQATSQQVWDELRGDRS